MTILITGSNGKTASELTSMLTPQYPVLIATRSPDKATNHPNVKFDWTDSTTYSNPFEHEQAKNSPITAVYLVGLESDNRGELLISFVHLAVSKGVRRFVLLSSAEIEEGGPLFGQAHGELHKLGDEGKLEWAVLRPHFFMENFIERGYGGYHWQTIMEQGKIFSAAGKGKKPYISTTDIAATAYRALVDEKPHNADLYITGPESLTYDDIAAIFSEVLGRNIEHVSLTGHELAQTLVKVGGVPEDFAAMLGEIDEKVAKGHHWEKTDVVERVTGRPARTFKNFVIENKNLFAQTA
ncbi:Festuclavine dehydrogenase [Cercospora beticola]|uniref:Festuclavine dehydrogenase n=1 Tax=Cercospora beticola TaxID=122368 RepID=A0A2G5HZ76_CERBT|nr:Festuclavine dehydrogenase [Cercospora beticola]PIA97838.1 Festuclavine dehydrogenase [Cercospora beticola]WPA99125.1 hypothetical protein RHO25_003740 [Cercospora beticola]